MSASPASTTSGWNGRRQAPTAPRDRILSTRPSSPSTPLSPRRLFASSKKNSRLAQAPFPPRTPSAGSSFATRPAPSCVGHAQHSNPFLLVSGPKRQSVVEEISTLIAVPPIGRRRAQQRVQLHDGLLPLGCGAPFIARTRANASQRWVEAHPSPATPPANLLTPLAQALLSACSCAASTPAVGLAVAVAALGRTAPPNQPISIRHSHCPSCAPQRASSTLSIPQPRPPPTLPSLPTPTLAPPAHNFPPPMFSFGFRRRLRAAVLRSPIPPPPFSSATSQPLNYLRYPPETRPPLVPSAPTAVTSSRQVPPSSTSPAPGTSLAADLAIMC